MQTRQGAQLERLQAVQDFINKHADKLAAVIDTGARKELAGAIESLTEAQTTQTSGETNARGHTNKQRSLRDILLKDHMGAISRIARANLPPTPELEVFRMPRGRPTVNKLAAAAYGMANSAEPYAATFISAGMPTDFIARCKAAADDMVGARRKHRQSKGDRTRATQSLKDRLARGTHIVKILDSFVGAALRYDNDLRAEWNRAKRTRIITPRPIDSTNPDTLPSSAPLAPTPPAAPGAPTLPAPSQPVLAAPTPLEPQFTHETTPTHAPTPAPNPTAIPTPEPAPEPRVMQPQSNPNPD